MLTSLRLSVYEASTSNAAEAAALTAPKRSKLAARPHRALPSSHAAGVVRPTKWSEREEKRQREDVIKAKERAMKQAKEDEAQQKREARLERKRKKEERERLDAMAQKVSSG